MGWCHLRGEPWQENHISPVWQASWEEKCFLTCKTNHMMFYMTLDDPAGIIQKILQNLVGGGEEEK